MKLPVRVIEHRTKIRGTKVGPVRSVLIAIGRRRVDIFIGSQSTHPNVAKPATLRMGHPAVSGYPEVAHPVVMPEHIHLIISERARECFDGDAGSKTTLRAQGWGSFIRSGFQEDPRDKRRDSRSQRDGEKGDVEFFVCGKLGSGTQCPHPFDSAETPTSRAKNAREMGHPAVPPSSPRNSLRKSKSPPFDSAQGRL
jgi:hypothetical protein